MTSFHCKPVLVPVDYSIPSLNAARIARAIAESDSDVTLLHVALDFDLAAASHNWVADIPAVTDADRLEQLRVWRDDHQLGDVRTLVKPGDPGTEVCKVAEEQGSRLIVVSTHGHHGLKRLLLGSVAERIIRHCHCPVLVLHRADGDTTPLIDGEHWFPKSKVVVPIDFSDASRLAIQAAIQAADSPECVDVINVVPALDDPVLIGSTVTTDETRRVGRLEYLQRYLKEHGHDTVKAHVLTGDPGTTIVEHAEQVSADLIVMPSHGYHGLKRLLLGSTTERVLRYAPTPVLVLRRPDAE